jgi:hypothetical protein
MTTKDWLVEINKWLRKNGYETYRMSTLTTKQWSLVKQFGLKTKSLVYLDALLSVITDSRILERQGLLTAYTIACVDGMMEQLMKKEEEKKRKEKILSAPGEKVRAWAKDKREHPEKYAMPKKLLDGKTAV